MFAEGTILKVNLAGTVASKYLTEWTEKDSADWITSLDKDFEYYRETFEVNKVDGIMLQRLKSRDLTKLGIKDHAEQKIIMAKLRKLIQNDEEIIKRDEALKLRRPAPKKSFIIFPKLRNKYSMLAKLTGPPVKAELHGFGFDTTQPLVDVGSKFKNYFVATLHRAFINHLPVTLRPDDIWLVILQGLAIHIRENADQLRSTILKNPDKEGKQRLYARDDTLTPGDINNDWSHMFKSFTEQIGQHTVEGTPDLVKMEFSTSTPITAMAAQCVVFAMLSPYFDYEGESACGIPEVFLCGTVADWARLRKKVDMLRRYKLDWWLEHLIPVCDEFVLLAQHLDDTKNKKKSSLSSTSLKFWRSIYKYDSMSGGPFVSGWVNALFPYCAKDVFDHEAGTSQVNVVARNDAMDWDGRGAHKQQLEDLANLRAKKEAGASDDVALPPPFAVGSNVEALRGGYFGSSEYRQEWCPAKVRGIWGDGVSKFKFHIAYDNDEDGQPYTGDEGWGRHAWSIKPDKLRRLGAAPAHSAEARALPSFVIATSLDEPKQVLSALAANRIRAQVTELDTSTSSVKHLYERWNFQVDCLDNASWKAMQRLQQGDLKFAKVLSLGGFHDLLLDARIKDLEKATRAGFEAYVTHAEGIKPEKFPSGYTSAPMRWNCLGLTHDTHLNGGFFGCAQNPESFSLEPVIGWCVTEGKVTLTKGSSKFNDYEEEEEEEEKEGGEEEKEERDEKKSDSPDEEKSADA